MLFTGQLSLEEERKHLIKLKSVYADRLNHIIRRVQEIDVELKDNGYD